MFVRTKPRVSCQVAWGHPEEEEEEKLVVNQLGD